MRISYCVIFDSKRSKAVSKNKAGEFRQKLHKVTAEALPIVPYSSVRHLQIYDAIDIAVGFCTFKK